MNDSSEADQNAFVDRWIQVHIQDSDSVLQKPLIIGEFGRNFNLPVYIVEKRDGYFRKIYNDIYNSSMSGDPFTGGIFWQLLPSGLEELGDGYQVVLEESPSTANVIAEQSRSLSSLP